MNPLPWLRVSYSSLNTLEYCDRKFEFHKIYGQDKARATDESIPAEVGKAFHEGLQSYIVHRNYDLAMFELLKAYPWHLDLYADKNTRTWDVVMSTFDEAIRRLDFGEYELVYIQRGDKQVPCTEVPFELRFLNTEIPGYAGIAFVGYIDLILKSKMTFNIATTDIKTHQSRMRDRTAEYKYNTQQVPYGIVVEHLLGNKIDSFDVTYLDCFLDLTDPRVSEFQYTKDRTAIQEWMVAKYIQFSRIKTMMQLDMFPRRENGCVAFQYPCRFLDICASRSRDNINAWFSQIEDVEDKWEPWVVAEIDMGVALA